MGTVWKPKNSKNYYIAWYDHEGKRRTENTKQPDKAKARRICNKYESDAALRRSGVVDPAMEGISLEAKRTIDEHLVNFANKMRTAAGDDHIDQTLKDIRFIAAELKWKRVDQITAEGVEQFAAILQAKPKDEKGGSARTIQRYLTAIKSFTKWLADHKKLPRDPLVTVSKPSPDSDRRLERRMMLPEEWQWLKSATESGDVKRNTTGADRRLLYETALYTALRSGELRSLKPSSFFLDGPQPYIICRADRTKNGKLARQYVSLGLAAELKAYIKGKSPTAGVFAMPNESDMAELVRFDLAAARKLWLESIESPNERAEAEKSEFLMPKNNAGEVLDFHALRHTCGAWLSHRGLPIQEVQKIMRHSSITLTIDTYGHMFPGQEVKASQLMEQMISETSEMRWAQRAERETAHSGALWRDEAKIVGSKSESRNPLRDEALREIIREKTTASDKNKYSRPHMLDPRTAVRRVII